MVDKVPDFPIFSLAAYLSSQEARNASLGQGSHSEEEEEEEEGDIACTKLSVQRQPKQVTSNEIPATKKNREKEREVKSQSKSQSQNFHFSISISISVLEECVSVLIYHKVTQPAKQQGTPKT